MRVLCPFKDKQAREMTFLSPWSLDREWGRCHMCRCSHEFDLTLPCSRPSCGSSLPSPLSPHLSGGPMVPDPCWPPALFLLVHAVAASSCSLLDQPGSFSHMSLPLLASPAASSSLRSPLQEALPNQLGKCSQSTFSHKYKFTCIVIII